METTEQPTTADTESPPRSAVLIMNTLSGDGKSTYSRARELLQALGTTVEDAYPLEDPSKLNETLESALAAGHKLIILGGGDGSVSSAVDLLAHHHAVLGLLPTGTANDFAKSLEIPTDLEAACETIARGRIVTVDLGLMDDDYYVNLTSVGLGAQAAQEMNSKLKRIIGPLAYPVATIRAFFRHRPFEATIRFPDGDHEEVKLDRLLQIGIGNGRYYGGGLIASPEASINDHSLDVYAIQLGKHRDLLNVIRFFRSGQFVRNERVSHYRTKRVHLETDEPMPLNVDGELTGETPQEFRLAADALRVIVPRDSTIAGRQ